MQDWSSLPGGEVAPAATRPARRPAGTSRCRACGGTLHPWVDLGMSPLCESFLSAEQRDAAEIFYPLKAQVCDTCWLAQLGEYVSPETIFDEYAYFSSYSEAWMAHAADYVGAVVARYGLDAQSQVIEVASNDGYLLRNFVARGIPCLGIEPARNVAIAAEAAGVPTRVAYFGTTLAASLADEGLRADLVIGNNVLAQVPDLNDFTAGLRHVLKPEGVLTLEFPHLARLIEGNQFDTIYHEHFSYFSLASIDHLFAAHGLRVFDVEEVWTHGGSLRIYAALEGSAHVERDAVGKLRVREAAGGVRDLASYAAFARRVEETKDALLTLLIGLKRQGARVAGYGAPGKGNTLLNYCGIRGDLLAFTVDRNPYKWGRFLPGTHIPVLPPTAIQEERPDYVLILPWNLKDEIARQLAPIREWGGQLIVPIPHPEILPWPVDKEAML
ncbi:methyltransferase family protein [Humitalea rosea]|uniref:Methyltransferase family protein n=1 Tax=Humitalea rosea TaxID=990373 RepID=A0A2W7I1H5_9PROT|nr:class I SAM-dependent methyltransferase [Humitalea rosea]PZW40801.1 methyltransferase family protein [Humitalea rosea]